MSNKTVVKKKVLEEARLASKLEVEDEREDEILFEYAPGQE